MLNNTHYRGQGGFSLIELLVVMVIITIVAAFALMQRGSADIQFKIQNSARDLKVAFERARFDSVKRRTDCTNRAKVVVNKPFFELWIDKNQNGVIDNPGDKVTTTPPSGIVGFANSTGPLTTSVEVKFNSRGEVVSAARLWVCKLPCTSPSADPTAIQILVTPTGTVDLLPGNASAPVFGDPGVTAISANTDINEHMIDPAGGVAQCAP